MGILEGKNVLITGVLTDPVLLAALFALKLLATGLTLGSGGSGGSGGAVTGTHFDLVLADDLESDATVYTASQRDKTKRWFRATVLPMLTRGGLIVTIGTSVARQLRRNTKMISPTSSTASPMVVNTARIERSMNTE